MPSSLAKLYGQKFLSVELTFEDAVYLIGVILSRTRLTSALQDVTAIGDQIKRQLKRNNRTKGKQK